MKLSQGSFWKVNRVFLFSVPTLGVIPGHRYMTFSRTAALNHI